MHSAYTQHNALDMLCFETKQLQNPARKNYGFCREHWNPSKLILFRYACMLIGLVKTDAAWTNGLIQTSPPLLCCCLCLLPLQSVIKEMIHKVILQLQCERYDKLDTAIKSTWCSVGYVNLFVQTSLATVKIIEINNR